MPERKTIIYTQPGCPACHRGTKFLAQKGVEFEVKNVREDLDAMQEMVRIGSQVTPTTIIDGEVTIASIPSESRPALGSSTYTTIEEVRECFLVATRPR
jgi:glutaredoxin